MFRLVFSSVADLAIVPLQDVLRKNSQARMNFPGKAFGNWQWRFTFDEIQKEWKEELAEMAKRYERV